MFYSLTLVHLYEQPADWKAGSEPGQRISSPALTSNDCPVIARARSEARNTVASATSASVARSGSAIRSVSRLSTSAPGPFSVCAVNCTYACTGGPHIQPGNTVLTRIRSGPSSRAIEYIALVSAPFEAAYAACRTCEGAATADCVPTNTTEPPPAALSPGRQARVIRSDPSRFTSMTDCQVAKSASSSPPK